MWLNKGTKAITMTEYQKVCGIMTWPRRVIFMLSLACFAHGCGSPENDAQPTDSADTKATQEATGPTFPGVTLKVAALEDPSLSQVTADLVGEWRASRKADVEVVASPVADPKTGLDPSVDVWLIRGQRLGEWIDKDAIEPLADLNADWASRPTVFDSMVTRYGPDRYSVPLGTSVLVMAYKESVINDPAIKAAAEKAGIAFPPTTWDAFDKYVPILKSKVATPLAQPTVSSANDMLPLDLFLARATAMGKHRDHFSFLMSADSMVPRVDGTPFVDSLKSLVALSPGQKMTPEDSRKAFREGKSAILIDYAENASKWANSDEKGKIGVAPLPGSLRVYEPDRKEYDKMQSPNLSSYIPIGGGWVAVLAKGRTPENANAAKDFLIYLAGNSMAAQWAADRRMQMVPTRDSLLASGFVDPRTAPRVESGAWGESILKQLTSPNIVVGLRIPQAGEFLADLDHSVQSAYAGGSVETALKQASEAWTKRVKAYGPERMKWHYRRSLVKPLTDPKAPPMGR